jgi:hypothetical protein
MASRTARFDTTNKFPTRIDAIKHLKGQGFHAGEGETWNHVDGGEGELVSLAVDENGPTAIRWNEIVKAGAKAA